MKKILFIALSLFATCSTFAWDGNKTGKIAALDVTGAQNFGFRLSLEGSPVMCANGGNQAGWAYINKTNDNYQAYVSLLTAAMFAGKTVGIYSNFVGGSCEIGYITVIN